MRASKTEFPPVYPITDKKLSRKRNHLSILIELIRGGARLIQIRDKYTPPGELLPDLLRCVEYAETRNAVLILNDRCDLVLSCGASGVHLGRKDLPPQAARQVLGRKHIIGYSTHSLSQVQEAMKLPVDYIGFGPVYATRTKKDPEPVVGLELLKQTCDASTIPVVAIGGINLKNIRIVLKAGASSAAVISGVMDTPDIARKMEEFLAAASAFG